MTAWISWTVTAWAFSKVPSGRSPPAPPVPVQAISHKASRALHRWSNELKDFQDGAIRLEKSAGEKLDERAKAEAKVDGKGSKELGEASSAVDGVIQKVRDLEERYNFSPHR
ncbi:hypothetical protein [Streptomyces tendae]